MTQNLVERIHDFEEGARRERSIRELDVRPFTQFHNWQVTSTLDIGTSMWVTAASTPQSQDEIELPFDPGEFGRSDISELLATIHEYDEAVKTAIYRHTKDFYLKEASAINPDDVIHIRQTQLFAEDKGHEDWITDLESVISSYFDDPGFNEEIIAQSVSEGEIVEPRQAKELYNEEESRIENAVEEVYVDLDEEARDEIARREEKRFLLKLISKIRL